VETDDKKTEGGRARSARQSPRQHLRNSRTAKPMPSGTIIKGRTKTSDAKMPSGAIIKGRAKTSDKKTGDDGALSM